MQKKTGEVGNLICAGRDTFRNMARIKLGSRAFSDVEGT